MMSSEKRQVSFRISEEEWEKLRRMHHERCVELGTFISKTAFLKEVILAHEVATQAA